MKRLLFVALLSAASGQAGFAKELPVVSHPPLRTPVLSAELPMPKGPAFVVDPLRGDDAGAGSKEKPWRSIQESLPKLRPGDTLLLRGGTYFENVYCAIVGTEKEPITIRSYPGETAIIDGGIPEFERDPAAAWVPGQADGEYVSAKAYPNLRDVVGLFADSNIGLQTYWHLSYLTATKDRRGVEGEKGAAEPGFYCGPGIFYDKATGKIHARFAPTKLSPTRHNYSGESDPRKIPLSIAPFRSTPLHIDQGMHLRFQNLVIRGGGLNTVQLSFAVDVEFEYVTVFGGTYCIRAKNSGPVKITHSGVYGGVPPWGFWTDNALHTYDGKYYDPFTQPPEPRAARNVARLPTHALLVTEGYEESDVFALPLNNRWEIAYCEFADGHDGIYLNGREMWIHHSTLTDIQDDGFYLSNPTPGTNEEVYISHNFIARCTSALGAHLRGGPLGDVHIYGNIFDLRDEYLRNRPGYGDAPKSSPGHLYLPHGRGSVIGMENLGFYYNTVLRDGKYYAGNLTYRTEANTRRNVYNNIFVYSGGDVPSLSPKIKVGGQINFDGNLHWVTPGGEKVAADWLQKITDSVASQENVSKWQGLPWEARSKFADPRFIQYDATAPTGNDLRLSPESPAIGLAIEFPESAALRGMKPGKDAGALQLGEGPLRVGINGRRAAE